LRIKPKHKASLVAGSRAAIQLGEFTEAASLAAEVTTGPHSPGDWTNARRLVGRVRETDARWRPRVHAPTPAGTPPADFKVLYLAKESRPFLHNGFCTRSHETLRALTEAHVPIEAMTMPGFPGRELAVDAPSRSTVDGVTYRHVLPSAGEGLSGLGLDEYVELSVQVLAGHVLPVAPSLLHITSGHRGFETALVGWALAEWLGTPWLYEVRSFFETTWTSDTDRMEEGEYYLRRLRTETRAMRSADAIVTISGPMRDEIVDQHGVPADRVVVIPNGVDIERFSAQPRDDNLRRRLGLRGKTLGYVSNVSHPREGQEVLIRAVAHLLRQGYECSALIVGDGRRRPELESLARSLGIGEAIVFTGNVPFDDVSAYYAQIDLFVVPRVNERAARLVAPMKPLEAMAMQVPLLVADLPALVEITGGGDRGHAFKAGDAGSLADGARQLLENPAECHRIATNAFAWVAAERSWSAVARQFLEAYAMARDAHAARQGTKG
jgi:glycosyltransferase involved in cell wall biosynthesis